MQDNLFIDVVAILSTELNIPVNTIRKETLLEDIDIDSLDVMKLAIIIENKYKIKIKTKELEGINSFGDILTLLELKMKMKE